MLPYLSAEYEKNEEAFQEYYDEVEICQSSSAAHFKAAMQVRNREMVDRADLVLCYIERKSGGAYQTVLYAKNRINRLSTFRWDDNILRVKITNTRDGFVTYITG